VGNEGVACRSLLSGTSPTIAIVAACRNSATSTPVIVQPTTILRSLSTIHRVVPDFVVQDGDPRGDGEGGPGFTLRDELSERPYLRGTVGMALDWPDTGGSQFFITLSPQPHLDAKYSVIGEVVAGMDVADRLAEGDVIRGVRVWDGKQ